MNIVQYNMPNQIPYVSQDGYDISVQSFSPKKLHLVRLIRFRLLMLSSITQPEKNESAEENDVFIA